jgi:hypothetical protein
MTVVLSHHVDGLSLLALAFLLPVFSIKFGWPVPYGIPSSVTDRPHTDLRSRVRQEFHRARVWDGQLPLAAGSGLLLYE